MTQDLAYFQATVMNRDKIERMGTKASVSVPVSVDKRVRDTFITFPDHTWIGMDWSAAELYYWAAKSGDPVMLEDIKSGDIHAQTSLNCFGVGKEDELFPQMREAAKIAIYNAFYSGFDSGIVTSNVCRSLQKKYPELGLKPYKFSDAIDSVKERWCVMYQYMIDSVNTWRNNGGFITYGENKDFRRISTEGSSLDPIEVLRTRIGWQVINCQSQNSVALAMKKLITLLPYNSKAAISIYDALYYQVPTSELEKQMKDLEHKANSLGIRCDNPNSPHYGITPLWYKADMKTPSTSWGGL